MGSKDIAPLILNLDARWRWVPSPRSGRSTPGKRPRYPFCRRFGGPQGRSVLVWRRETVLHVPRLELGTVKPVAFRYKEHDIPTPYILCLEVDSSWNVMAHGDAREGKWRGNWRMEWLCSTLHTTSEHGVSSITTADALISAAGSRLNWRPPADLNGLVRLAERRNMVSARLPSHFNFPLILNRRFGKINLSNLQKSRN